jgi:hypothetical protein
MHQWPHLIQAEESNKGQVADLRSSCWLKVKLLIKGEVVDLIKGEVVDWRWSC